MSANTKKVHTIEENCSQIFVLLRCSRAAPASDRTRRNGRKRMKSEREVEKSRAITIRITITNRVHKKFSGRNFVHVFTSSDFFSFHFIVCFSVLLGFGLYSLLLPVWFSQYIRRFCVFFFWFWQSVLFCSQSASSIRIPIMNVRASKSERRRYTPNSKPIN